MTGSNQDAINVVIALAERIGALEEENRKVWRAMNKLQEEIEALKKRAAYEWQLAHQVKRIDDIEEKIDWSKKGKI